jgi:hypothetical protein
MNPYRKRAPHPDAMLCPCGWRQPVRLYPRFKFRATDGKFRSSDVEIKLIAASVVITCPDCGLEHVAEAAYGEK